MKIVDASTKVQQSIFLHGLTGSGKSTWSEDGGFPLVVLTEPKAESVLHLLNPDAVAVVPESLDDLEMLMVVLGEMHTPLGQPMLIALLRMMFPQVAPKDASTEQKAAVKSFAQRLAKVDRIVLDSFTELTHSAPKWMQAKAGRNGIIARLDRSEFGDLRDYAIATVKAIQLTGLPSVIIARSISKRVGLVERIVPDGLGSAVDGLPGKLLPTAEARFDPELGYVIDTTPADHSQRCGLPWVPGVFKGSCLEYLQILSAGPAGQSGTQASAKPGTQASAQATDQSSTRALPRETKPAAPVEDPAPAAEPKLEMPGGDDPEWVDMVTRYTSLTAHLPEAERKAAISEWGKQYTADPAAARQALADYLEVDSRIRRANGPDPEKDPEGYRKAFGAMCQEIQAEKIAASKAKVHDQAAADFVDGVSPECASGEAIRELMDACEKHKINPDHIWNYAISKGQAKAQAGGAKNWTSLSKNFTATILGQLAGQNRTAFCSWLAKTYAK